MRCGRAVVACLLAVWVAGCANPYTNPEGYRRDVDAFFQSPVGKAVVLPLAFVGYTMSGYRGSTTVHTDQGSTTFSTWCVTPQRCNVFVHEND